MNSRIIAFCGVDGSGKSTMVNRLEEDRVIPGAVFVRKSNTANCDLIRRYHARSSDRSRDWIEGPFSQAIAYAGVLDALQHYRERIEPLLENSRYVVCDRYWICFVAFLLAVNPEAEVRPLVSGLRLPDLVVYVDVNTDLLPERYARRGAVQDDESPAVMEQFKKGYERFFSRIKVPMLTIANNETFDTAYAALKTKLNGVLERKQFGITNDLQCSVASRIPANRASS